jgi:hypothetical protein
MNIKLVESLAQVVQSLAPIERASPVGDTT